MKKYIAFFGVLVSVPCYADVYSELQNVYNSNPVIGAARADVSVADAELSASRSGYKPYLGLMGSAGYAQTNLRSDDAMVQNFVGGDEDYVPTQVGIQLQQNLFTGGATIGAVRSARAGKEAQQAALDATQQSVFYNAINSYINVLNTRALLDLAKNNTRVLTEFHRNIKNRQDVGQTTKTDSAQAAARLEQAKYQESSAQANYDNALESYRRIYGDSATGFTDIDTARMDKFFPTSLESAEEYALKHHPSLLALDSKRTAATETIAIARHSMLPTVDLRAQYMQLNNMPYVERVRDGRVGVYLTVPLYDKGSASANVDKVRATVASIDQQQVDAKNAVIENLRAAWNVYQSQDVAISAATAGVRAAEMALSGTKDEQEHGRRTVLDVLNAEQELLNARTSLIQAQHGKVSAYFAILAAMGNLTPQNLGLQEK